MDDSQLKRMPSAFYENWSVHERHLKMGCVMGRGATCEVYHGKLKTEMGVKDVAVKKLWMYKDEKEAEEQLKEIKFLKQLEHRNIIKFVGVVQSRGKPYRIVTELASKGSLYDYLKEYREKSPRLPGNQFFIWSIDGAYAIQYLQQMNVTHRDIKSLNFLITSDDVLKLCDFGIAKNQDKTKSTAKERGTHKWMAPEVFMNLEFSFASDIFSFAIVIWELFTCEEPYKGMTGMQVLWAVGTKNERPEIPSDCPDRIRDLLVECWQINHNSRPKINEVVARLEEEYVQRRAVHLSLSTIIQGHTTEERSKGLQPVLSVQQAAEKSPPISPAVELKMPKSTGEDGHRSSVHSSDYAVVPDSFRRISGTANPTYVNRVPEILQSRPVTTDKEDDISCDSCSSTEYEEVPTSDNTKGTGATSVHEEERKKLSKHEKWTRSRDRIGGLYTATRAYRTLLGDEISICDGEVVEVLDVDQVEGFWQVSLIKGRSVTDGGGKSGWVTSDSFAEFMPWLNTRRKSLSVSALPDGLSEDGVLKRSVSTDELSSNIDEGKVTTSQQAKHSHQFRVKTWRSSAWCNVCSKFIYGVVRQGLKCKVCRIKIHRECERNVSSVCDATYGLQPRPTT